MIHVNEKFRNIFALLIIYYRSYIYYHVPTSSDNIDRNLNFLSCFIRRSKMKSSNSDNDIRPIRVGRTVGDGWCKRISDDHTIEITQGLGRVANRERKQRHIGYHHREPGCLYDFLHEIESWLGCCRPALLWRPRRANCPT